MNPALAPVSILGLEVALLCAAVLLPAARALRRPAHVQGRQAPALALHRAQREALDRDRDNGLLQPNEHREAALEVDRRLLAEASLAEGFISRAGPTNPDTPDALAPPMRAGRLLLLLGPIPGAALALYAIGGHPTLPAQPLRNRIEAARDRQQGDAQLVATLRDTLSRQDPNAPETRQGFLLLGQTEAARGDWAAAAAAWRTVLAGGFDPVIAVQAAEAQSRADGGVSAASAALFRRALAEGSQDAAWRSLAEQRIAEFEHGQDPH